MEIKINVELGITPAMEKFATTLLAINKAHPLEGQPSVNVNLRDLTVSPEEEKPAQQEEPKKTRRSSKAKKEEPASTPTAVEGELKPEAEEPKKETKTVITLPDLRQMIARVWNGGKNKAITDGILAKYGAKNLTELKEEYYSDVINSLAEEAEKLGL